MKGAQFFRTVCRLFSVLVIAFGINSFSWSMPEKPVSAIGFEELKDIIIFGDSAVQGDIPVDAESTPEEKAFSLGGFIQATGAFDTEKNKKNEQTQTSRNKIRLEGKWRIPELDEKRDSLYTFASIESDYLWFGPHHHEKDYDLDLFEGYLHWSQGPCEFRLGKQIVRWGKTDQISPVDNINSQDLREFIVPDLEDRKIPNWMARIQIFSDFFTLEGVYIPFFEPSRMDYFGTDWAVYQHLKQDIHDSSLPSPLKNYVKGLSVHEDEPAKTFENGEWGARVSSTINNWDITLSYLYAWEDLPHYQNFPIKNFNVDGSLSFQDLLNALGGAAMTEEDIDVTYKRSNIYGFEFETTAGKIGLRGEAAYFEKQSFLTNSLTSIETPVFFYVLGGDYLGVNDWYVNVQFAHQIISDHADDIIYFRRNNTSLNGEISKEFWRGNLEAVLRYNYGLSDNGYYLYPRITLKYVHNLEITLGANLFGGDNDTLMGRHNANDQVFVSFKYFM